MSAKENGHGDIECRVGSLQPMGFHGADNAKMTEAGKGVEESHSIIITLFHLRRAKRRESEESVSVSTCTVPKATEHRRRWVRNRCGCQRERRVNGLILPIPSASLSYRVGRCWAAGCRASRGVRQPSGFCCRGRGQSVCRRSSAA